MLLALTVGAASSARAQTTYSLVPLTAASFTADIVANGAAASPPTASTTADVDGAGYYLISQDYYTATTSHTSGIPNNGAISNTIVGPAALTYQLASLSANNALRLAGATSGTLTFATPITASDVYVLGISGSGVSTVDVTVNYADGTTTAFTGQTYPDWFTVDATRNVFGTSGRASVTTPVSATAASNTAPFLTQLRLTVPTASLNKNITSITFGKTSIGGVLDLLAVSVGSTPLCNAVPTGLTTVASTTAAGGTALTTACSGTSIYLSVSGVPANAGYTYQWQSSTTSATTGFANISGATGATYTATGQTAATYYRVLVGCQFATGSTPTPSTAVQVTQSPVTACYCTPTYSNGGSGDIVARVQLGTLDNNTTAAGNVAPYYHDYAGQQTGTAPTLQIPTLVPGSTATATLTFGTDGTQNSAIWVDFNQNGTFEASEFFVGARAGASGTTPIAIAVPATATVGTTKLRVRGGDDAALTSGQACGASGSSYGEAEDYLVSISAATCTPSTATFSYGSTSSYCVSGTTNPTVVLAAGATAGTFSSTTGLAISATTGAITLSSSTPGTYTVTNTVAGTATACASTATASVTVTAPLTAGFSYGAAPGPGAACAGGSGTFTPALAAGATRGTFTSTAGLALNATTGVISLTGSTAGTYTITNAVAASGGCAAATSTATFTVNALPPSPTLTVSGTPATGITLTSSAATGNQFSLNGTAITGATGQTYLVNSGTRNGSYTVTVTNAAGCSATSAAQSVTVTATAPAQAATGITASPNPTADGYLLLELTGFREPVALTVVNMLGQRVYEGHVSGTSPKQQQALDLHRLPTGVYLLHARTASGLAQTLRFARE
ncbi:hypothetical protein GCM10028824_37790 [Hymenobacter segetis]